MSNIKLSGENILGMELAKFEDAEDLVIKGRVMRGFGFWAVGKGYKKILKDIAEGNANGYSSLTEYCVRDNERPSVSTASEYMSAYDVVQHLSDKGVTPLPMSKTSCLRLKTHPKSKWVKLWKDKGVKIKKYVKPKGVTSDTIKEEDVDGFIQDAIYQIQNFTETLDKIQNLINKGVKPEKDNALILTSALKELHDSLLELAGIE